jgi:hypothetical protein
MELLIKSWNINYWKERERNSSNPKSDTEMDYWLKTGIEMMKNEYKINNNSIKFILMQEASLSLYEKLFEKEYHKYVPSRVKYHECSNYGKWKSQGLVIDSMLSNSIVIEQIDTKGAICINYLLPNKEIISIINVHTQKYDYRNRDYSEEYVKYIERILFPFIRLVISKNKNNLIIFSGDLNMNRDYREEIFIQLKDEFDLTDCTNGKRTMIDYDIQNDYIFCNKPQLVKEYDVITDIDINFSDHWPICCLIEL